MKQKEEKAKEKKKDKRPPLNVIQQSKPTTKLQAGTSGSLHFKKPYILDVLKRTGVLDELEKMMNSSELNTFLMGGRTPKTPAPGLRTRSSRFFTF